ncbi:chemotaxis protein CheB [Algibacter sp. PT7-4]|uniref:chemotaxis protein CheB n=1 Tax=Algibacter ulvanivorans TaxID=3400999 RepID=UPI003AACF3F0
MEQKESSFYTVGIGASAGGLKALQELFDSIPSNTGMAFVIIQHLSPDFESLMPELLSKHTSMPIYTAKEKQNLKPNCIYLNIRTKNLQIKGSKLHLQDRDPKSKLNLPIDIFFHTLGEEFKDKAVAVILSGTGSDGSRGIRTVKESGGTIIVQNPSNAQFNGMPNSAINTNTADYILNIKEIANTLVKKPTKLPLIDTNTNYIDEVENNIKKILTNVFKFSGIDFREYKKNTLLRRIEKRMNINNIHNLDDYAKLIENNTNEKQALKEDFLIGVTRFFRDEEAFLDLKKHIIPEICTSKKRGDTIRIWIPGCSTGEEVYSIAILFQEYITENKLNINFKIFATDIDPRGLNIAGFGLYDVNIINELDKDYLERYFFKNGERFQIIKSIREKIVFSNHNLISDAPFINMDFISCRNLLIYLDINIQKKVMQNFQFSLNIFGYLFLGNSESLRGISKYFKTINSKWKIFQNITKPKYSSNHIQAFSKLKEQFSSRKNMSFELKKPSSNNLDEYIFDKYLSRRYSPDSIFIDSNFNILFITGGVGKKLYHSEGAFQNNLLKVVNTETANIIRTGIRRLENEKQDILITNIINKTEHGNFTFDLKFHKPLYNQKLNNYYLIEFSEEKISNKKDKDAVVISNINISESSNQRIEDLEYELNAVKADLQKAIEELETTNEELQSSNEELMASNEELQSTNEELQSVNEELYTVNTELQEKNDELTNLSNDVSNLLDNTEIATAFLDTNLRIRKFTPALKNIFNLHDDDIGRPLANFTSNFDDNTRKLIINNAKLTLEKLTTIETQLEDSYGNFYFQRISPFITSNKTIDGIVITIDNINKIKEIEKELAEKDIKYHNLFENLNEGFIHAKIITDKKGKAIDWQYLDVNPAYEKLLNLNAKDLIGQRVTKILPGLVNDPNKWIEKYGQTALTGEETKIEGYVKALDKYFYVNAFSPKKGEFAATVSDFTELKRKEEALIKSQYELNRVQKITHVGSWSLNIETGEVEWTEELFRIFRLDSKLSPPNYGIHKKLFTKESWNTLSKAVEKTKTKGIPYELELNMVRDNNEIGWLWAKGEAVKNSNNKIIGLRGSAQDITEIKNNQKALIYAKKQAEASDLANRQKNYFLANMSHEIRTPMTGVLGFAELLKADNLNKKDQLKYIEIIDNNSKQLLNLIDVSKIETNEIKLVYKECHISNLIKNLELTYNQIKVAKNKSNLNFVSSFPKNLENLVVLTDPQRLEQVICNLLNNALKFSEKGDISFGFSQQEDYIKFYVKDHGIGIAKNKQKEIFERFKQLNLKNKAKYGGTGLGLSICKGIVTLLGGEIWVESKRYQGTLFEFTIPLKKVNTKINGAHKLTKNFLKNKSILIAEDDKLIRMLLAAVLKNTGANVTFANNGKIAVKYFKDNPNVDIILLDIRMPEMNGIEAMEHMLKINPKAKIIMQTAHAMEDEKEICFKKGCVDFLSKPIVKEKLFETIGKWLN